MSNEPTRAEVMKQAWNQIGKPTATPQFGPLTDDRYRDSYCKPLEFISMEAMEQVMGLLDLLPCPVCTTSGPLDTRVTTYRMCVVLARMPLGSQGMMAIAMCHHCGLTEQWADDPPELKPGDFSYNPAGQGNYAGVASQVSANLGPRITHRKP